MHYVKRELLVINATDNAITKLYPDIYIFLKGSYSNNGRADDKYLSISESKNTNRLFQIHNTSQVVIQTDRFCQ